MAPLLALLVLAALALAPGPVFGGGFTVPGGASAGSGVPAGVGAEVQRRLNDTTFAPYGGTTCTPGEFMIELDANGAATCAVPAGGGAPTDATYIMQTPSAGTSAEQALSALGSGLMLNQTGTGVISIYGGGSCTNQVITALSAAGVPTCTTMTLASAQFANQGTTTTVLHGNASGNPSFGAVVTGDLADGAVTYAKLQDVSATQRVLGRSTAGAGDPEEVSATTLFDWIGTTRGAVLYRGASGWAILAPGTSGFVLTSNGAGADPTYQAAGAGTVTSVALSLPSQEWDVAGSPVTDSGTLTATRKAVNARGTISGAQTIDWNVGVEASATLDGSTTFTFSNEVEGSDYLLDLQPAGNAITWPTITWLTPNGQAPPVPASGHLYVYCMFRSVRLCRPTQADAASAHQVYRMPSSGPAAFGAIDLSQSAATTNQLPPSRGGTGSNTTATSGRYLKGDGANWGTSSGAASGVGACSAGQFVSTLNSDAAPTCDTPAGGSWTRVLKTGDETRTATTTLAADSTLVVALSATTNYHIKCSIFFQTPDAADFKYRLTGPASPTRVRITREHLLPGGSGYTVASMVAYSSADHTMLGSAGPGGGHIRFSTIIQNGSNAGNFAFEWAQNTSDAGNTIVEEGSFCEYSTI